MASIVYGCIVPHPPVMVPAIGEGREQEVASSLHAMSQVAAAMKDKAPEVAFIISPHGIIHYDALGIATGKSSQGTLRHWGALVDYSFPNDQEAVKAVLEEAQAERLPIRSISQGTYDLDHGVMVPAYFLEPALKSIPLVPLSFTLLPPESHYRFGKAIQRAAKKLNKRVAFIASGDLSHRLRHDGPYGFNPAGRPFDEKIKDSVAHWDIQGILSLDPGFIEEAGECGLRSIVVLLGTLDGLRPRPEVLAYEGPFGVGYLTATMPVDEE